MFKLENIDIIEASKSTLSIEYKGNLTDGDWCRLKNIYHTLLINKDVGGLSLGENAVFYPILYRRKSSFKFVRYEQTLNVLEFA